jgi:hypothetical protein
MDNNQQVLATILSSAIRGKYNMEIETKNINWENILGEAKAHDVHAILYPLVKNLGADLKDKELFYEWRKIAILEGMSQIQHINEISKVLSEFNAIGIQAIVLKGLAIRELYPNSEFRSMSDADILIHKKDIDKANHLLMKMGYTKADKNSIHIQYEHKEHLPIELHWILVNDDFLKTAKDFEDSIWGNFISININNISALTLSSENQLLHLCLHMAVHIISSGFGLRQLCDLILVIESIKDKIDWRSFYERCKLNGIATFVTAIFTVCNELFQMELPGTEYLDFPKNSAYIDMLINDIFSAGVHGKRNAKRVNANAIARTHHHKNSTHLKDKFTFAISMFFPPTETLNKRYSYAKRFFFLKPVALVHRLIFNIFYNDFNIYQRVVSFFSSIPVAQNRAELIKWLKL